MKAKLPGPSAPAIPMVFISPSSPPPTTLFDRNNCDLFISFVHDSTDNTLDLTLMPQFFTADSPTSSLSTPTTQTSFEDSQSSASSSLSYTTTPLLSTDKAYLDAFTSSPFFDGPFFATTPLLEIKQEPSFFLNPYDSFDMCTFPPEYKHFDSIHRSIEMPASPQPLTMPTFTQIESYERTARPFQHSMPNFSSTYTSSSEDTTSDAPPLLLPMPKKPARASKQDKGIKCDHCGVDKTPLWRKVPHKENSYHCNACGLYYKSNGHFRALEGETRVVRTKKPRKHGDSHPPTSTFRSGPVTANKNISCANCATNTTVLWRKGPDGQSPLCNPCGLFYKLHGTHRSPEKKKEIHRRNRTGKKRYSISTEKSAAWDSADEGDDEIESPVVPEFAFRRQSQGEYGEYVKTELGREYSSTAAQVVPQLPEFLGQPQYQYQWQVRSVQGRC